MVRVFIRVMFSMAFWGIVVATAIVSVEKWTAKTQLLQERWGANAGRTVVRPPAPHFPAPSTLERGPKREDDGREGAVSGRLARRATGVNPSGFARIGGFAGKRGLSISSEVLSVLPRLVNQPISQSAKLPIPLLSAPSGA